jgi:hypothetical protein
VVKEKFIPMISYVKNTERSPINNLMLHFKLPEKQEQAKSKTSRKREIIKIRTRITEIETKNLYKQSKKQRVGSLKSNTHLADLPKTKREQKTKK